MRGVGVLWSVLADVSVNPTTDGMPGASLIQQILNWLAQVALWGSLGSILAGAGMFWVGHQTGHFGGASKGKTLAVAGAIGACLAGLAPSAGNRLYRAAQ